MLDRSTPSREIAAFDVDAAWDFHRKTREKPDTRNPGTLTKEKFELQRALDLYRVQVKSDFDINLTRKELPEIFTRDEGKLHYPNLSGFQPDRRWYKALERMRADTLKSHYELALDGIQLPALTHEGKPICTDVGSRSDHFRALMHREHPSEEWHSVDVKDYSSLPAMPTLRNHTVIEPLSELPKSDIITLNFVLHHVGEDERNQGRYDDAKTEQFIDTVHNALPAGGLVVVTEDFIGKDKEEPTYRNFIKGVDALFYPKALGNQKPSADWIKMFKERGFKLEKQTYPVAFNVVGFPVVESVLVFRKR